jgi:hypothetical protein
MQIWSTTYSTISGRRRDLVYSNGDNSHSDDKAKRDENFKALELVIE